MQLRTIRPLLLLLSISFLAACSSTSVSNDNSKSDSNDSKKSSQEGKPRVVKGDKPMTVKGFDPVIYFDFDKSVVKSFESSKVVGQAEKIKKDKPKSVIVEGHTDQVGTKEYNIALGERRANSTKKALVKSGISKNDIEVVSYGKERLIDTSNTPEGNAKNRRTVTILK